MELKRDLVKYIRDKAKSRYQKGTECFICGDTEKLDFHHFYSLSPLLHKWVREHNLKPSEVLEWREEFIDKHDAELYDHTVTLCHTHHLKLHSLYGKDPSLATAKKQERWVRIQREKHGLV
jgi:hypothetical protein|tara:strand:- start:1605 stop:1967 length:363 start_codon:yes stop_codon:yes gene_type:complete